MSRWSHPGLAADRSPPDIRQHSLERRCRNTRIRRDVSRQQGDADCHARAQRQRDPRASHIGATAAAPSHPTNAMAALLHHERAAYARTATISSDGVAGWFTGEYAKGQVAQRSCSFLGRPLHPTRIRNSRLTVQIQNHLILAHAPPALSTCTVPSTAGRPPHTAATHPAWCPSIA